jgi:hypothetical protein
MEEDSVIVNRNSVAYGILRYTPILGTELYQPSYQELMRNHREFIRQRLRIINEIPKTSDREP